MPEKNILVVGGAGFIGSNVNQFLQEAGFRTIVFDNLSRGNEKTVLQGKFIRGDIGCMQDLENVFASHSIDAVMHFAAFTDVGESCANPALYYRNNVAYTLNLLDCMHQHKVKNIIFSSSAAVYGFPQENRIAETHPCQPINPYGETKWMMEKILHDYAVAYGFKTCALRYFNAAGGDPSGKIKNYPKRENNLIPIILRNVLAGHNTATIFGTDYPTPDGSCVRDYIHVHDLARAHHSALLKILAGAPSNYYNLGNGLGFSVRQVIQAVETVLGKPLEVIEGARRAGDPPFLVADASKAARELGWSPHYAAVETMVEHAWAAMQV